MRKTSLLPSPQKGEAGEKAGRSRGEGGVDGIAWDYKNQQKNTRARTQLQCFLQKLPHIAWIKISQTFLEITRAHAQLQGFVRTFSKDATPFSDQSKSPILRNHARTCAMAGFLWTFRKTPHISRIRPPSWPQVGPKTVQEGTGRPQDDPRWPENSKTLPNIALRRP